MSSPRSQELMNKNSQHQFRFTSQYGLQIACTRSESRVPARAECNISHDFHEAWRHEMLYELNRGQVRTNILVWLSSVLHDQSRNREALWPR
jgi:hypothetical protein